MFYQTSGDVMSMNARWNIRLMEWFHSNSNSVTTLPAAWLGLVESIVMEHVLSAELIHFNLKPKPKLYAFESEFCVNG